MSARLRVHQPPPVPPDGRLAAESRHHLERVLRLRPGAEFFLVDGHGGEHRCRLGADGTYKLIELIRPQREPRFRLWLAAAVVKGDGFEWVLEKAGELGVAGVVPLLCARCVAGVPGDEKATRWRRLLATAMLQSDGCRLPQLAAATPLAALLAAPPAGLPLVALHERAAGAGEAVWRELAAGPGACLLSGPEGGFCDEEAAALTAAGVRLLGLGPRLFKAETAPIVAAAVLLHRAGDLG